MTTSDRFDSAVASWLRDNGPADIRPAALAAALAEAARRPQRRGIRALLGTPDPTAWRLRVVAAVALGAIVVAGTVFVLGSPSLRPVVPTPTPSHMTGTDTPAPSTASPSPSSSSLPSLDGWINVSSMASAVHVLTPDGVTSSSFTTPHGSCPRLSPDGSEVGYKVRFYGIKATSLAGGNQRGVASSDATNNFGFAEGVWSPNRAYLAFRVVGPSGDLLRLLPVFDGRAARTAFSIASGHLLSEAAWSADSSMFAIAYGPGGSFTVAIVGIDGGVRKSIGPFPIADGIDVGMHLALSPDGTHLAYLDFADGGWVVDVIDIDTGLRQEHVASGSASFEVESPWSRDGRWLASAGFDGILQIASVDGTKHVTGPKVVPEWTGFRPRWSPTEDVVAVMTPSGLATITAGGGLSTELMTVPDGTPWGFDWSPDGSRIVVAVDRGGSDGIEVSVVDATGREAPVRLATYPTIGTELLCVSWDAPTAP